MYQRLLRFSINCNSLFTFFLCLIPFLYNDQWTLWQRNLSDSHNKWKKHAGEVILVLYVPEGWQPLWHTVWYWLWAWGESRCRQRGPGVVRSPVHARRFTWNKAVRTKTQRGRGTENMGKGTSHANLHSWKLWWGIRFVVLVVCKLTAEFNYCDAWYSIVGGLSYSWTIC